MVLMEVNVDEILQGIYCDELFLRTKPEIRLQEIRSAGTSWNEDFVTVEWEDLSHWDDFSEETIDLLFDEELRTPLGNWTVGDRTLHAVHLAEKKKYKVTAEKDVDTIVRYCLQNLLIKTINFYGNDIRRKMGKSHVEEFELEWEKTPIYPEKKHVPEKKDDPHKDDPEKKENPGKKNKQTSTKKGPDWPLFTTSSTEEGKKEEKETQKLFMFGDAKRHRVFDPEKLSKKTEYDGASLKNTMGQMGMYAYWGKTRYAYVITSKTLTVFRFFLISKNDNGRIKLGAEYTSFGWDDSWKMIPKAIWALAMLSMKDDEREVVTRQEMLPISTWRARALPHPKKHEGESDKEQLSRKQEHDAYDSLRSVKGGRIKKPSGRLGTKKTETLGNAGLSNPVSSVGRDGAREGFLSSADKLQFRGSIVKISEKLSERHSEEDFVWLAETVIDIFRSKTSRQLDTVARDSKARKAKGTRVVSPDKASTAILGQSKKRKLEILGSSPSSARENKIHHRRENSPTKPETR